MGEDRHLRGGREGVRGDRGKRRNPLIWIESFRMPNFVWSIFLSLNTIGTYNPYSNFYFPP